MKVLVRKNFALIVAFIIIAVLMGIAACLLLFLKKDTDYFSASVKIVFAVCAAYLCGATLAVVFDKEKLVRMFFTAGILTAVIVLILFFLEKTGVREKFDSVEEVIAFVRAKGAFAALALYCLTLLQVVILPIPGIVTFTAGVSVFGVFFGGLICFAGIFTGSLVAFIIGRKAGVKAAAFFLGRDALDKTLRKFNGKDKLFLTIAFLFPFFPDDALCFAAGLTNMSFRYFLCMVFVTRLISCAFSALSIGGLLIPFDNAWGIALWTLFGVIMAFVTYLVYRNGEKVGEFASKMLFRARKTHAYRKERRKGLQKNSVCGNISKIDLE